MSIKFTFFYYFTCLRILVSPERDSKGNYEKIEIRYSLMTVTLLCGEARYRLQNLEGNVSITDSVANRRAIPVL